MAAARGWAKALKRLDPEISLVSCGQTGVDDWDRVVIDGLARYVDFHSIHLYTGAPTTGPTCWRPHYAERALAITGALIDRARYGQRIDREIGVAYDEWNVWFRDRRRAAGGDLHPGRRAGRGDVPEHLRAPAAGSVRMANLAQLVNVIAPIVTSQDGLFRQPIFHPFALMASASHEVALDTFTDSGTHAHRDPPGGRWPRRVADLGPFPLLDVAATRDSGSAAAHDLRGQPGSRTCRWRPASSCRGPSPPGR